MQLADGREVSVVWFNPRHTVPVWAIERVDAGTELWIPEQWSSIPASSDWGCVVLEDPHTHKVLSYLAFQIQSATNLWLRRLVTARKHRNLGAASCLLVVAFCLGEKDQTFTLSFPIRESDLPAQKLLRKNSFRCEKILPNYFNSPTEPAYLFTRVRKPSKTPAPTLPMG